MSSLKTLRHQLTTAFIVGSVYGFPFIAASLVPSELTPEAEITFSTSRPAAWIAQLPAFDLQEEEEDQAAALDVSPPAPAPEPAPAPQNDTASQAQAPAPTPTLGTPAPRRVLAASDRKAAPAGKTRPSRARSERGERGCLEGSGGAIAQETDGRYTVTQDLFDSYSHDLKAAMKLAWVGWHRDEKGKIDGFTVRRIRCGSPLYEAGLRNGDIIHAINGRQIDNYAEALAFFVKVRRQDAFHLKVDRGEERLRLHYRVV